MGFDDIRLDLGAAAAKRGPAPVFLSFYEENKRQPNRYGRKQL